jgi:hypothetical protein
MVVFAAVVAVVIVKAVLAVVGVVLVFSNGDCGCSRTSRGVSSDCGGGGIGGGCDGGCGA